MTAPPCPASFQKMGDDRGTITSGGTGWQLQTQKGG